MQSQFSLFADPAPPATWVSGPPVAVAQSPVEPAETNPEPETDLELEIEAAAEMPVEIVMEVETQPELEPAPEPEIQPAAPPAWMTVTAVVGMGSEDEHSKGLTCPNCGSPLEGRKCKLLCLKPGCGYMVTCSEW